jgi:DNA polymerase-1
MLLARSAKGIEVDFDVIDELKAEMALIVNDAEGDLAELGVDTTLSRDLMKRDLVRVLAEQGRLPKSWPRLKNGAPSAEKRWLEKLEQPGVDAMLRRSQADRFASDYADKLVHISRAGRIHPQVAVLVAVTGRSSYGDPPLQQFPPSTRRMLRFDTPATSLDWSSIEPAFFANVVGETELIELYESGGDLYQPVMEAAEIARPIAKTVLLALLYGQGVASLSTRLGRSEEETADIVDAVLGRLTRIKDVSRKIRLAGNALGLVQTMSGRIIPLDRDPRTPGRFFGYRGINYVVQGSCYDLLSEALVEMHRQGLDDALYVAVHDELVVAADAADDVARIMATPPPAFVEMAGRVPVLRTGRSELGYWWKAKE